MKDKEFKTLIQVATYFSDNNVCKEYLEKLRWNSQPQCPRCNNDVTITRMKNGHFKCRSCKKPFSVTKGTIFENSQVPLQKWFVAIWLESSHKKGISSLQLSRDIDVTQKTAWFMLQRIRYAMQTESFNMPLSGIVEADETFVGGKEKNKSFAKRTKGTQGRSTKTKTAVAGVVERGGRVRARSVKDVGAQTLNEFVRENVEPGSFLCTDEWKGYNGLHQEYYHGRVNHRRGQYVDGDTHTNTIEGFWSLMKRGILGVYHSVSRKHIDRYVKAAEFRYNTRSMTEFGRFLHMLNLAGSSRITYKKLVDKA